MVTVVSSFLKSKLAHNNPNLYIIGSVLGDGLAEVYNRDSIHVPNHLRHVRPGYEGAGYGTNRRWDAHSWGYKGEPIREYGQEIRQNNQANRNTTAPATTNNFSASSTAIPASNMGSSSYVAANSGSGAAIPGSTQPPSGSSNDKPASKTAVALTPTDPPVKEPSAKPTTGTSR